MDLVIEPLVSSHHDRAAFSCDEPSLDTYLRQQARQDVSRDLAACYVLCERGGRTIIGYYTLSARSIEVIALPPGLARDAGRYGMVPAALLGRLAVASHYSGQRMGEILLFHALRRTLRAGMGIRAIIVDALHERAATFYEHYEFQRFADGALRLYLPMSTVRALFPGEGAQSESVGLPDEGAPARLLT